MEVSWDDDIPNIYIYIDMESHNPFHGSSHHQPDILLFQSLTIINHRLTIINHQPVSCSKPPSSKFFAYHNP